MTPKNSKIDDSSIEKVDNHKSEGKSISLKNRAGDAANNWIAKNRSLVLRQTPVWAQSVALLLFILGTGSVAAGILFRIDEVVTVKGQLKSIGGNVEVKTPVGGKISEVFVKEGQAVSKGDKLLVYDTRKVIEDKNTALKLISLENEKLKIAIKGLESRIKSVANQKDVLKRRLQTKQSILGSMESLVYEGGFQRLTYLERKDEVYTIQKQLNDLEDQEARMMLDISTTKLNSQKAIDQLMNNLNQFELQLTYQNVLAPVDGVIFDLKASVDGVLEPSERILSLIPQKGLFAEVFVTNSDIGYIKIDQEAKVRVDAFPFTRYGELNGHISHIGAEALPPDELSAVYRFPIKIRLENSFLKTKNLKIPLKSGMSVTSNLKLRDKPVISLISDIFVDQTDSIRSIRQQ